MPRTHWPLVPGPILIRGGTANQRSHHEAKLLINRTGATPLTGLWNSGSCSPPAASGVESGEKRKLLTPGSCASLRTLFTTPFPLRSKSPVELRLCLHLGIRMNGDQKSIFAQEKQDFVQYFSQIVKILTEEWTGHPEVEDAIARLKKVLEYNALGGKYNRGLSVLMAFRELVEPRKQDADSLQRARAVGWCVELVSFRG
uniref:(2E,6E)-farnesyl diphosphate synthase n=1 Tax=Monodelphis domestica TaxID=13616 RepID=A0A5F8HEU5_MONDO